MEGSQISAPGLDVQAVLLFEKRNLNKKLGIIIKISLLKADYGNHGTIGGVMKTSDVPLPEIQNFMNNRSAEKMKCLLEERISDLDLQIMHLKAVRKTLCSHQQNMETLLTMDLSEISVITKEERCLVTVDIDRHTTLED